jgi:DNA-binding winged helix-turn-helix (wHTH) protein
MSDLRQPRRFRFGIFEADLATGELRRQGVRIRLNAQPFQLLIMLLERHGELLTREEIARELWPDGTFVDFEHGVNSAISRIREALGDSAGSSRFVETLARRGYRFIAPVELIAEKVDKRIDTAEVQQPATPDSPQTAAPTGDYAEPEAKSPRRILATPDDLPPASHRVVRTLFVLFQLMYLAFYIGALANLPEIEELLSPLATAAPLFNGLIVTAAILIPVRAFLLCAVLFRAPGARNKFLRLWPFLLVLDVLWSLSPFLLLHHIHFGVAISCTALLVYSPFAQRSLVLMGAASAERETPHAAI